MKRNLLLLPLAGFAVLIAASAALAAPATQPAGPIAANVLDKFSKNRAAIDDAIRDASKTREQDPMRFIARDMRVIGTDLGALKTNEPVQAKQQQVVADLNSVIKKLEEACKSGGGGGSLNPTKPMSVSKLTGGPGGVNDLHDPKAGEKAWGALPPKQRDQILQSKTDGFPTGYDALLQSYYRRLSAEKVSDDSTAPAGTTPGAPSTQPATR